ncbi:MAG: hypothetical protein ACRDKJ_04645 [Actinomycetota bacterium]
MQEPIHSAALRTAMLVGLPCPCPAPSWTRNRIGASLELAV